MTADTVFPLLRSRSEDSPEFPELQHPPRGRGSRLPVGKSMKLRSPPDSRFFRKTSTKNDQGRHWPPESDRGGVSLRKEQEDRGDHRRLQWFGPPSRQVFGPAGLAGGENTGVPSTGVPGLRKNNGAAGLWSVSMGWAL